MRPANPFPAYPVAVLDPRREEAGELTVMTPGIRMAEDLIDAQLASSRPEEKPKGLNVGVQGEFGTGKTHLLAHAAHCLSARTSPLGPQAGVVRVGAMESSPAEWYRAAIGRRIVALDLPRLATDFYAAIAKQVALRAPLTAAAADRLDDDSASVRTLLRDELLSSTSVELELIETLERIAGDSSPEARAAIEGLVMQRPPALRWLEGQPLSGPEEIASGLPQRIESAAMAADAVVLVAAIHRFLGRPFLLLIDELEHLVRFDTGGGKGNVTWLKRLLERLAGCGAIVFVAGHTRAWEGHPDFLDRFSATIELTPLGGDDVIEIVERFEGERRNFDRAEADLVAEAAGGNIRRVLGMLHDLHDLSEGFDLPLATPDVLEAIAVPPAGVDPEQAIEELEESLRKLGVRVLRQTTLAGLPFDIVAYRDTVPVAVIEVKHALFDKKQQEQAQRFLDKVRVVNREAPECVGVFAAEGRVDPALLEIDSLAARVHWLDLTAPDFAAQVQSALAAPTAEEQAGQGAEAASERDAALTKLVDEIQEVKARQEAEYQRLEERLDASGGDSRLEFRSPTRQETQDEKRAIFETFSERPSRVRRLGLMGPQLSLAALLLVLGISLVALAAPLADAITSYGDQYVLYRSLFFAAGLALAVVAFLVCFRRLLLLDRFYTFKRERLRDVYVLDAPVQTMVAVNQIIDESLYDAGPAFAIRQASELLEEAGLTQSGPRLQRRGEA